MILRGFDSDMVSLRQSGSPSVIPAKAGIQRGGEGECSAVEDFARRGACPRWGRAWAWQNAPCQAQVLPFIPWCAGSGGMSDCYENSLRQRLSTPMSATRPPFRHSGEGRSPEGRGRAKPANNWRNHGHPFHPLMRPSQVHRRFRREHASHPDTGPESRWVVSMPPNHSQRPGSLPISESASRIQRRRKYVAPAPSN